MVTRKDKRSKKIERERERGEGNGTKEHQRYLIKMEEQAHSITHTISYTKWM